MKLIAENLHIISKTTKEAILARDSVYIKSLIKKMSERKPDWIDLNIGPARANFSGTMKWLMEILNDITDIPVSFDTTNTEEIREGLILAKKPSACLINSTSADIERLEKTAALAAESGTNIIALTLNSLWKSSLLWKTRGFVMKNCILTRSFCLSVLINLRQENV